MLFTINISVLQATTLNYKSNEFAFFSRKFLVFLRNGAVRSGAERSTAREGVDDCNCYVAAAFAINAAVSFLTIAPLN